jgi:hypothetical protein
LVNFFPYEPEEGELGLREFASSALTPQQIGSIVANYMERGADQHTVRLEVEAFSVARVVDADTISQVVENVCSLK